MNMPRWIHWPRNRDTGMVSWYVIAWRMLWSPLIYAGMILMAVGLLCGYGVRAMARFWDDVN